MAEWVVVGIYPGRHIAEMMAGLLENEGIATTVAVDDTGGLHPQLALTQGVRVRVPPEEEDRARRILMDYGDAENTETPPEE